MIVCALICASVKCFERVKVKVRYTLHFAFVLQCYGIQFNSCFLFLSLSFQWKDIFHSLSCHPIFHFPFDLKFKLLLVVRSSENKCSHQMALIMSIWTTECWTTDNLSLKNSHFQLLLYENGGIQQKSICNFRSTIIIIGRIQLSLNCECNELVISTEIYFFFPPKTIHLLKIRIAQCYESKLLNATEFMRMSTNIHSSIYVLSFVSAREVYIRLTSIGIASV